jgi:5-methylcytosine-specific restriction endonuclease McrA
MHRDQDEKCADCDRFFGSLVLMDGKFVTLYAEPEDFIPRARRLNNSPSNIVAACQVCNDLKGSREFATIEDARTVCKRHGQSVDGAMRRCLSHSR